MVMTADAGSKFQNSDHRAPETYTLFGCHDGDKISWNLDDGKWEMISCNQFGKEKFVANPIMHLCRYTAQYGHGYSVFKCMI